MYIREFSHESIGERILKIGAHLRKLLSDIKWLPFFGTQCRTSKTSRTADLISSVVINKMRYYVGIRHDT